MKLISWFVNKKFLESMIIILSKVKTKNEGLKNLNFLKNLLDYILYIHFVLFFCGVQEMITEQLLLYILSLYNIIFYYYTF